MFGRSKGGAADQSGGEEARLAMDKLAAVRVRKSPLEAENVVSAFQRNHLEEQLTGIAVRMPPFARWRPFGLSTSLIYMLVLGIPLTAIKVRPPPLRLSPVILAP
jgi:hypothetical protein